MAQTGDLAFCTSAAAASRKRKAYTGHLEAPPAILRRQNSDEEDDDELARLTGQVVATAAKSSDESVKINGGLPYPEQETAALKKDCAASMNDATQCVGAQAEVENSGGSTMERPIVIEDDEDDLSAVVLPEIGDCKHDWGYVFDNCEQFSPFGYRTWDPTDNGRYELLSTYVPPPCLDADLEDDIWWLAAAYTSPLYMSPADEFWGTPDGVWTLY